MNLIELGLLAHFELDYESHDRCLRGVNCFEVPPTSTVVALASALEMRIVPRCNLQYLLPVLHLEGISSKEHQSKHVVSDVDSYNNDERPSDL